MRKKYSKTAALYAKKLEAKGYSVRFNWSTLYGEDGYYEDVTVRGRRFNGYGGEFSTTKEAYDYIVRERF